MSRKKFWAYLRNEEGQPIPSASISFRLNDTGQLAQLYTTPVSAVSDEVDQTTLTTDVSGFFQFFVGDVYETGKKIGYDPDQLFKLEWTSADGTKSGVIDDMQIFYQIFPVDSTDQYSSLKNKLASNRQTYNWDIHRQQTWFHEIHDITHLDWSGDSKNDGTYSKVVSNQQMNYLQTRLDSVKASGADSVTIESSAAIARSFDIPSGSWSPSGDLYCYNIVHNFDSRYPLVQLWCTALKCTQYPARLDFVDNNTLRVFVPSNERDGKHIIAISDISPVLVYQNPLIDLNLQELSITPLTVGTNIITSKTVSAGLQTLSITPLNTTTASDVSPTAALQTLTMTSYSSTISAASSGSSTPIPIGLIVPFNDDPSSIPADWSLWLNSDSSAIIMGAPSASSPSVSGGSNTVSSSAGTIFTTTAAGEHGSLGGTFGVTRCDGGIPFYPGVDTTFSSGDHTHDLEQFDYEPEYSAICFIQSDTDQNTLPSNAVVLSESGITGLSNVLTNSGRLLKLHNSLSPFVSGGGTPLANLTAKGNHRHDDYMSLDENGDFDDLNDCTDGDPPTYETCPSQTVGEHTPTDVSIYVSQNLKRKLMSAWTHSSQSYSPSSGMIAMWESWTPPTGWEVCDGTNGTPDLRDHFVELVVTGSEDLTGVGNHTLTISASDTHDFVSHDHTPAVSCGTAPRSSATISSYHEEASYEHTHTGLVTDFSWKPLYQTVVFIRKST